MNVIIEDALEFARSGTRVTDTEPVDLNAVATDAWSSVESGAATLRLDGDAVFAADRSRLRRLFENLYRNAIEHGGSDVEVRVGPIDAVPRDADGDGSAGEATVDATAGEADADRDRGGFYVVDDGPGIPPDRRADVFDHGFTTRDDGTGFGLAIVDAVAGAHDWSVDVTEGRDGGARFEVTGCRFVTDDFGLDRSGDEAVEVGS